jgi:hypothetical protein
MFDRVEMLSLSGKLLFGQNNVPDYTMSIPTLHGETTSPAIVRIRTLQGKSVQTIINQ